MCPWLLAAAAAATIAAASPAVAAAIAAIAAAAAAAVATAAAFATVRGRSGGVLLSDAAISMRDFLHTGSMCDDVLRELPQFAVLRVATATAAEPTATAATAAATGFLRIKFFLCKLFTTTGHHAGHFLLKQRHRRGDIRV